MMKLITDLCFNALTDANNGNHRRHANDYAKHGPEIAHFGTAN
jgi:hypothetical protein